MFGFDDQNDMVALKRVLFFFDDLLEYGSADKCI